MSKCAHVADGHDRSVVCLFAKMTSENYTVRNRFDCLCRARRKWREIDRERERERERGGMWREEEHCAPSPLVGVPARWRSVAFGASVSIVHWPLLASIALSVPDETQLSASPLVVPTQERCAMKCPLVSFGLLASVTSPLDLQRRVCPNHKLCAIVIDWLPQLS